MFYKEFTSDELFIKRQLLTNFKKRLGKKDAHGTLLPFPVAHVRITSRLRAGSYDSGQAHIQQGASPLGVNSVASSPQKLLV